MPIIRDLRGRRPCGGWRSQPRTPEITAALPAEDAWGCATADARAGAWEGATGWTYWWVCPRCSQLTGNDGLCDDCLDTLAGGNDDFDEEARA